MKAGLSLFLVLFAVTSAPGAEPVSAPGWEETEARKMADVAAQLLTSTLIAELNAALEKGGAAEAVRVCGEVAQEVTQRLSERHGVVVRRTSLRTRNPANGPDAFEKSWLERAARAIQEGRSPAATYDLVARPDGGVELRHLRPILFPGGVCSQCHGRPAEISSPVRAILRQRYPDDAATGYAPGDLRGAISVRVRVPRGTGALPAIESP